MAKGIFIAGDSVEGDFPLGGILSRGIFSCNHRPILRDGKQSLILIKALKSILNNLPKTQ